MRIRTVALLALALACFTAQGAFAQHPGPESPMDGPGDWRRDHGPEPRHEAPVSHRWKGDIHRFHDQDLGFWQGGRWFHGPHDGRDGWWWIVDNIWYFYTAPVYPYPDPFTPPTVVVETVPSGTSVYWYCSNPSGYYPYVPACSAPWQKIIGNATPIVAPAPVVAPVPAPTQVIVQPSPQSIAPAVVDQRTLDDRQLNSLGAEFASIHLKSKKARRLLRELEPRVEVFRKTLLTRTYNAMDILRDTEVLHDRIIAALARLNGGKK